jgi:putative membrane protein insertion efficiency factor
MQNSTEETRDQTGTQAVPAKPGSAFDAVRLAWKFARLPSYCVIALVRLYQFALSPIFGRQCRFHPTCSQYMILAVEKYGTLRGILRGIWRICRCHPWGRGGEDWP